MMMKRLTFAAGVLALLPISLAGAGMADHFERKKVEGVDVLVYPTAVRDVVTIMGAMPAGDSLAVADHENVAAAKLTAMMLDRGTVHENKFAIAKKLESVGASVYFSTSSQALEFQARCLSKDLPMVLKLIGEQLREPALARSEFEKARKEFIGQIEQQSEAVEYRAEEAFRRLVFPEGDPNRPPSIDEYKRAATALTLEQVKAFHRRYYGPDNMTLVLVGDVKMTSVEGSVASVFAGWTGGPPFVRDRKGAESAEAGRQNSAVVEMPGKTSTVLVVGQATGLRYQDPDTLPLLVGTAVLGSGFTGRLMHSVRNVEGLTYSIGAGTSDNWFTAGNWAIEATFAPELLDRGLTSTERELKHWWAEGITARELAARKTNLIGQYAVGLSNTQNLAALILVTVLKGKGVQWLDEYPKAIAAVSLDEVNQAIRRHLDPQKMIIVKAGTLPKS
jgi:zinc protease